MADSKSDEGPRSAMRFLETVGHGQCAMDLSTELNELGRKLRDKWADIGGEHKAELSLKLIFKMDEDGVVKVSYDVKGKPPVDHRPGSIFWITKGGNFSIENPKQPDLPGIREVAMPEERLREIVGEREEVR